MKKIFLILLLTTICLATQYSLKAADRENLYRRFGPKLFEANMKLTLTHINILRDKTGLPEFTMKQYSDALEAELNKIPDYEWMHEDN